jgi:HD domain-containing protein
VSLPEVNPPTAPLVVDVTENDRDFAPNHRLNLIEVALATTTNGTRRLLKGVKDHLDMDVVFVSEFVDGEQVVRLIEGDGDYFGLAVDVAISLEQSYRWGFLEENLANANLDSGGVRSHGLVGTNDKMHIGFYVAVPLEFSDRTMYGTLHCLRRGTGPSLEKRDHKTLGLLTRLIADELERQAFEARDLQLRMEVIGVRALLAALEARDGYTGEHSEAVVHLSRAVARELGLPAQSVLEIEQVALLHDVGKIGVPDATLRKMGPLDDDEWEIMRQHPVIGERIVASIHSLRHLAPAIRAEHERWDGEGYPDGLSGDHIPLASRIVLVSDAYHAMVSRRPYRDAVSPRAALGELRLNSGSQFCPSVSHALINLLTKQEVPF